MSIRFWLLIVQNVTPGLDCHSNYKYLCTRPHQHHVLPSVDPHFLPSPAQACQPCVFMFSRTSTDFLEVLQIIMPAGEWGVRGDISCLNTIWDFSGRLAGNDNTETLKGKLQLCSLCQRCCQNNRVCLLHSTLIYLSTLGLIHRRLVAGLYQKCLI